MNPILTNIGWFAAGVVTTLVLLYAWAEWRYRREMRQMPAEPVAPTERAPAPEPVAAWAAVPQPAAEVVFIERRPQPDLLPLPEPRPEEVPIFRQTPVPLPDYDSYSFKWRLPKEPFPTGSFPVVVLSDDIEGYQVSEVPPQQREGFEVNPQERRRLSLPGDLVEAVTASLPSRKKAEVTA